MAASVAEQADTSFWQQHVSSPAYGAAALELVFDAADCCAPCAKDDIWQRCVTVYKH
ncbi:MAG: hypothetical protein ACTFAL_11860 [Candidatus Electronema sp. V4]|uniref:hypothetical protein n=1 Tax=Candidatus Electronema sp. V4 TaxID=3454756 RepID=UPI004055866A